MQTARTPVLFDGTAIVTGVTPALPLGGGQYTAVVFALTVTASSGTGSSQTINAIIQGGVRTPGTALQGDNANGSYQFYDYAALTQVTTGTGLWIAATAAGGEEVYLATDGTLTAGQIRNGPIPSVIRLKYVIAGTDPSFTFSMVADLTP